jgi:hypothetical protein
MWCIGDGGSWEVSVFGVGHGVDGGVDYGGGWGEGIVLEAGAFELDEVVESCFVVFFGGTPLGPCRGVVWFVLDVMSINVGWVVETNIFPRAIVTVTAAEQVDFGVAIVARCARCGVERRFTVVAAVSRRCEIEAC